MGRRLVELRRKRRVLKMGRTELAVLERERLALLRDQARYLRGVNRETTSHNRELRQAIKAAQR
jgi:hypothetical protein